MDICLKLTKPNCTALTLSILTHSVKDLLSEGNCHILLSHSLCIGENHSTQECDVLVPILPGRIVVDVIKQINAAAQVA